MTKLEKEKLIDLLTNVQMACIVYGRALQVHEERNMPSTRIWLSKCELKWNAAEGALREFIDKA